MKALVKKSMALGLLGMMIISCSKNQEMTDQQKMQEFDFAVFQEKTIEFNLINEEGMPLAQKPFLLMQNGLPLAYGWSDNSGKWTSKLFVSETDDISIVSADGTFGSTEPENSYNNVLRFKVDLIDSQSSSKTEIDSTIDSDNDGVVDYLDAFPDDSEVASIQSVHKRLIFEDCYPGIGDYDFNDVAVEFDSYFYLHSNGSISRVTYDISPYHSGAAAVNSFGFKLHDMTSLTNFSDTSGTDNAVVMTNDNHLDFMVFEDFGSIGEYWYNRGGYVWSQGSVEPIYGTAPWESDLTVKTQYVIGYRYVSNVFIGDILHQNLGNMWNLEDVLDFFGDITTTISFDNNDSLATVSDFLENFDPYIIVQTGQEVHLKSYDNSYADHTGMPYGFSIPQVVELPGERQPIFEKYPNLTAWATSNGTTNQNWWE